MWLIFSENELKGSFCIASICVFFKEDQCTLGVVDVQSYHYWYNQYAIIWFNLVTERKLILQLEVKLVLQLEVAWVLRGCTPLRKRGCTPLGKKIDITTLLYCCYLLAKGHKQSLVYSFNSHTLPSHSQSQIITTKGDYLLTEGAIDFSLVQVRCLISLAQVKCLCNIKI